MADKGHSEITIQVPGKIRLTDEQEDEVKKVVAAHFTSKKIVTKAIANKMSVAGGFKPPTGG